MNEWIKVFRRQPEVGRNGRKLYTLSLSVVSRYSDGIIKNYYFFKFSLFNLRAKLSKTFSVFSGSRNYVGETPHHFPT